MLAVGWLSDYGLVLFDFRVPYLALTLVRWHLAVLGSGDYSVFVPDVDFGLDLCFDRGLGFALECGFFVLVYAARFENVCVGAY